MEKKLEKMFNFLLGRETKKMKFFFNEEKKGKKEI